MDVRGQPRDLAPCALRQRGAGRVVEGRGQVQEARGAMAHRFAQRIEPHAVRPDLDRRKRRSRRSEGFERTQEGGALDQRAVAAPQQQGAGQRDRLLRPARDHDVALRRGQPAPREMARDRPAQRGQPQRAVAVVPRRVAQRLAGSGDTLLDQARQRRQAGAGQVDRARRGREAGHDRVALHHHGRTGGDPLAEARRRSRRTAHPGAAALATVQPLVASQQIVRLDDGRAADRELACQHALGWKPATHFELASLDRGPDGLAQTPVERSRARGPWAELGDKASRHEFRPLWS